MSLIAEKETTYSPVSPAYRQTVTPDHGPMTSRSLQIVAPKKSGPRIAFVLTTVVLLVAICLIFVPYQQTIVGHGQVFVYSAMDRPQNLEAQIPGRLVEWNVQEGQVIRKGEVIARLEDIDSKFLDRNQVARLRNQQASLDQQKTRILGRIAQMEKQRQRLNASRQAALSAAVQRIAQAREREKAAAQALVAAQKSAQIARDVAQASAGERLRQADDRIVQAEQALRFARQDLETSQLQRERVRDLFKLGLRSKRDDELAENDLIKKTTDVERAVKSLDIERKNRNVNSLDQKRTDIEIERVRTEVERATNNLDVARGDVANAVFDRTRIEADTAGAINSLSASLESARESLAKNEAERLKLDVDVQNVVQRNQQQVVRAPRDGRVVRLLKVGAGETVKAGDILAVLVPDTEDIAVELMVSDNDVPLLSEGRPVRLQFAGWPALQFAGFPAVAVGTFGGKVSVIDAVDDGTARYRVIVRPDRDRIGQKQDDAWPTLDRLRPGAEATGWIMLDTVPLGFELWRQYNAFPPTIKRPPVGEKEKDEFKPLKDKDGEKDKGYIPVKSKK
ncbi:MAG: HlyD family efflux transporter periplasmic adaptor subunit [Capsulimonadales bacterium]|nr:HlyD family efflux transporter periplasmic adaptor subunit [Capsulimonadales bacterium]